MLSRKLLLLVTSLVLGTWTFALGQDFHQAPAHPDLIKKLGRSEVARLYKAYAPEKMAADMQLDFRAKSARVTGTGTALVILWDFTDHAADQVNHPSSDYYDMMFSEGVFPTGSMNDYYQEVSYGAFSVSGTISGWTTANNTYFSYADQDSVQNASTCKEMIRDAIAQLDPILDFSQFDNDGPDGIPDSGDDDGYVDSVFFVHSGPGEEQSGNPKDIWSHAWSFSGGLNTNDGVALYRYSVEPEMLTNGSLMTMGVFAHEYGHVLGLPDLYDTDYSSGGIGEWGLMSGGSWNAREGDFAGSCPSHMTAWSKMQLGWLDPVVISSNSPGVVISPSENSALAYRVFRAGDTGGDEYFLVENRRTIGFDEGLLRRQIAFDLARPEGLVIYHIDDSLNGNSNEKHRLVDVVDASPWFHPDGGWHENLDGVRDSARWEYLDNFNRGDNGDVWPGFTAFTADSTDWTGPRDRNTFSDNSIPPAWDYECSYTGVVIENIFDDGLNVTADFRVTANTKVAQKASRADRVWDFETTTGSFKFCNSFAHQDLTQSDGCSGAGGLWFGTNDYDCPGYGNNWNDFAWDEIGVDTNAGSQISIRHKYDLESGYDFAYIELRPTGNSDYPWVTLATFNGTSGCTNETFNIPQAVLNDAEDGGVSFLDIRLRLFSDSGWSSEDGAYCGIGWWIDELSVSEVSLTAVPDLPAMGDVAHLDAPNPNPFNPATVLKYHIPTGAQQVRLVVFDQRGRKIRDLEAGTANGWHEVRWDGRSNQGGQVASGLYFARLVVDGNVSVQKMALVK